jgi:hypothetical protein
MVGPAKRAYTYDLLIYGSQAGYLSCRAQIELHGPSTQDTIAWVRFCDPGVTFPLDSYNNGIVTMHLPTSMFEPVLDILRTEKFVEVYFGPGQGFIDTGNLTIGGGVPIRPPIGGIRPPSAGAGVATRKRKKGRSQGRTSSTGRRRRRVPS